MMYVCRLLTSLTLGNRLVREAFWIDKLKTSVPLGLNTVER